MSKTKEFFVTSGLSNLLKQIGDGSARHTNTSIQVAQGIEFFRQQTRKIPMRDRPDVEHAMIDSVMEKQNMSKGASCKKGCSFCCHVNVQVTNSEAKQLAGLIKSGAVEVDMALLHEQAVFVGNDYEYAVQPREKNRCVFLGSDGACRVYDKRPTNCRKYLVRSDPQVCNTVGGRPEIVASLEVETMASGFADLDQNFDHLPKSVLRYLE